MSISECSTKRFPDGIYFKIHNGDEYPAEIYYSNGCELKLITNTVSDKGGLSKMAPAAMDMKENLLPDLKLAELVKVGADGLVRNHMRNLMECTRSRKQTSVPIKVGYDHSITNILTKAAAITGFKAKSDEGNLKVIVNGKVFE